MSYVYQASSTLTLTGTSVVPCVNNFDTTFQWVNFTISVVVQGITSPSLTGNIVTLGRNQNNFNGELVLSIVNQKLRFWDFVSDAVGFGFTDSSISNGIGTINSGINLSMYTVGHNSTVFFSREPFI